MQRRLFCRGLGAPMAPPSSKDADVACGWLESVIAVVTRDAPLLRPPRSSGRASACPLAQPPARHVAAIFAAGCSRPGGALANATPSAESCLVPPRGDRGFLPCAAWGRSCATTDECSPGFPGQLYHLVRGSSSSCPLGRWRGASWVRGEDVCGVDAVGVIDTTWRGVNSPLQVLQLH